MHYPPTSVDMRSVQHKGGPENGLPDVWTIRKVRRKYVIIKHNLGKAANATPKTNSGAGSQNIEDVASNELKNLERVQQRVLQSILRYRPTEREKGNCN